MRKRKIWNYITCTGLVLILIISAIFLPQEFNKISDSRYLNNVSLLERKEGSVSYNYDTSIDAKIRIFAEFDKTGKDFNPVRQTKENAVSEKKLMDGLNAELRTFLSTDFLPYAIVDNLEEYFSYAYLYRVKDESSENNLNADLLLWYMKFILTDNTEIAFCVDAYTYTIYGLTITDPQSKSEWKISEKVDQDLSYGNYYPEMNYVFAENYSGYLRTNSSVKTQETKMIINDAIITEALVLIGDTKVVIIQEWSINSKSSNSITYSMGLLPVERWMLSIK